LRRRHHRRLRRGGQRRHRAVRTRPRRRVRPRRRPGGPDGGAALDHRPDGAPWWRGIDTLGTGRGNRDQTVVEEKLVSESTAEESRPGRSGPVSVVLVDDHAMFRTGVRAELAQSPDAVTVVGEAADTAEAVKVVLATAPEVVLLDVHLPGGGGGEVIRQVHPQLPDVRFLALSVSDAAEDVIGTIRAGARGYVTKSITGDDLVSAIGRVAEGDAVFSPRLA